MIRVGIIGMGFMGGVHLKNWQAVETARVVAVCDANPNIGKAKQGNIDASTEELNLDGVTIYSDIKAMLGAENLDAVSITLPTHLHRDSSIQCLEAGVHVLCEKPMALAVEECVVMIAAAKLANKQLMIAHCIRFWPEYAWAKNAVVKGAFGRVLAADFSRLTYAPAWEENSWFADPSKSGGIALDLHIHDVDFIHYLFGVPEKIGSTISTFENGVPGHVLTTMDYGGPVVSATASWMMPKPFGFEMSFKMVFEKAAVIFDGTALTVYPAEGNAFVPEIESADGYAGEINYFAELIAGKTTETTITPEQARESVRMMLEAIK